jgi:phospholipid/cholesterol/gamma-HCH transport system substrate-binding protein
MQNTGKSALKVGILTVAVFVVFVYFTYRLQGIYWGRESRDVQIRFDFVGQLEVGNAVRLAGVEIGYVDKIGFQDVETTDPQTGKRQSDTAVIVTARIFETKNFTLHENSKAKIGQSGIIGDYYIELTHGFGPELETGEYIEGEGPFSLDDLAEQAVHVSTNLQQVLDNLNDIVGDQSTKESFSSAVKNVEQFTRRLNEITGGEDIELKEFFQNMTDFSKKVNSFAGQLEKTMANIDQIVTSNQENVHKTLKNTAEITEDFRTDVMSDLRSTSKSLQEISSKMDGFVTRNEDTAEETIKEFRKAGSGMREAMEKINRILDRIEGQGLGSAILGSSTAAQGLRQSVDKARRIVDKTSSVLDSTELIYEWRYYEDDRFPPDEDNNFRNDAGLRWDLSERYNLYLGANDIGRENEFELMLGYRYHFMNIRAGVIESEAAVGLDIQPARRLLLTAEGVGLTDDGKERLDVFGSYEMHDKIQAILGVEDVSDECFFNGGLRLKF